jgi:hypothetical protein
MQQTEIIQPTEFAKKHRIGAKSTSTKKLAGKEIREIAMKPIRNSLRHDTEVINYSSLAL